jgi:hypothetical protein
MLSSILESHRGSVKGTSNNWFAQDKFGLIKQEQESEVANIGDIRHFGRRTIAQNQDGFVRK